MAHGPGPVRGLGVGDHWFKTVISCTSQNFSGCLTDIVEGRTVQTWWFWTSKCSLDLSQTRCLWIWWVITGSWQLSIVHVGCWCYSMMLRQDKQADCRLLTVKKFYSGESGWTKRRSCSYVHRGGERDSKRGTEDDFLPDVLLILLTVFVQQLPLHIPINYTLELVQVVTVKNLRPALVQIYDYYQPSKTYSPLLYKKYYSVVGIRQSQIKPEYWMSLLCTVIEASEHEWMNEWTQTVGNDRYFLFPPGDKAETEYIYPCPAGNNRWDYHDICSDIHLMKMTHTILS